MDEPSAAIPTGDDITLERQFAVALQTMDKTFLQDTVLERSDYINFVAGQLTWKLQKLIWANPLGRIEVSYPATPWEHFRATYFPRFRLGRWFLRRKPIRETTIVKSAKAIFPEAHIAYPTELGRPIMHIRDGALIKED